MSEATTTEATEPELRLDPAKAYDSPEMLALYDADTVRVVQDLEAKCKETESRYLILNEEANDAKKRHKAAVTALRDGIDQRRENRGKPPVPTAKPLFDDDGQPVEPAADPKAEAWRDLPTSRLQECGLSEKIVIKLCEHGKDTLGKLSDYVQPSGSGWVNQYSDLKGIGTASADKISDAFIVFWQQWAAEGGANGNASTSGTRGQDFGASVEGDSGPDRSGGANGDGRLPD